MALVRDNPVLVKEVRSRMRGGRAYWIIGAYLALLGFLFFISYMTWWAQVRGGGSTTIGPWQAGKWFYQAVFITQAALVTLIAPALTAGAITIEREQRTFDMLAVTRLQPDQIVGGKLLSSTLFLAVLLTTSLPLAAICLLFGGVSPSEILVSYLVLLAAAFAFGAIGIFWTSLIARSIGATLLTYAFVLGWMVVSLVMLAPMMSAMGMGGTKPPVAALSLFVAIMTPTDTVRIFGASVPLWVVSLVLYLQTGALIATAAVTKVEHYLADRGLALRLQLVAAVLAWLTIGYATAAASGSGVEERTAIAWLTMALVGVLVPPLCSGVPDAGATGRGSGRSFFGFLVSGLGPRNALSQHPAGGLPYVLGLGAVALAYAGYALHRMGGVSAELLAPLALIFFLTLLLIGLVSALGAFATARRAAGLLLGYGFTAAVWVLPPLTMAAWQYGTSYHPVQETVYLCPYVALWQLFAPDWWSAGNLPTGLMAGDTPPWIVTSIVYGCLIVLVVALGELIARLRASVASGHRAAVASR